MVDPPSQGYGGQFFTFKITTNEHATLGQLFSGSCRVAFPKAECVTLSVLTDGKIAHLRHGRFCHGDFSTELLNFFREFSDRIHADVVRDRFLPRLTSLQRTIRTVVRAAGVDVPVITSSGKGIAFPAEQLALQCSGALRVVDWD